MSMRAVDTQAILAHIPDVQQIQAPLQQTQNSHIQFAQIFHNRTEEQKEQIHSTDHPNDRKIKDEEREDKEGYRKQNSDQEDQGNEQNSENKKSASRLQSHIDLWA